QEWRHVATESEETNRSVELQCSDTVMQRGVPACLIDGGSPCDQQAAVRSMLYHDAHRIQEGLMSLLRVQSARGRNDRIACPPQFRPDRHAGGVRMEFSKIHPVQYRPDPVSPPAASEARCDRIRVADDPVRKPGEDSIRV